MVFDTLENLELYIKLVPEIKTITDVLDRGDIYREKPGFYTTPEENVSYLITEFDTSGEAKPFICHKNTTVLEIVLSGQDLMSLAWRENQERQIKYDSKTDLMTLDGDPIAAFTAIPGRFAIFFPGEPYRNGIAVEKENESVKRVVFTIKDK
ncbi:MAG: YhcH/YjgK/YiaL family protein [Sphaerochaetaceae bacterium]|nr:YhcH/YjgK/YiaL family protein [Sphaerochaetaceae bacterium]